jgi:VanZ family protein
MGKLLIITALCVGLTAQAVETDKAAHFGVSYAFQTWMYGFSKKAFRLKKTEALIFATFTTLIVTTAAEYMPGNKFDSKDILANGIGAATASATILMFDF